MTFSELELPEYLLRAIEKAGYREPTAVQKAAIPIILSGKDLIVEAQTGTGKTAAFALPILKLLNDGAREKTNSGIHTLVLAPTRELCIQVSSFFQKYGMFMENAVKVVTVIGGEDIEKQILLLRANTRIVVATPGRLLDLLERKAVSLDTLKILVLDEADKILNLGFEKELDSVLKILPEKRQTLLISATYPPKVISLTEKILKDAQHLRFADDMPTVENISQRAILVDRDKRGLLLRHLVQDEHWDLVLVFVASKKLSRNLAQKMRKNGVSAAEFHADLGQAERSLALNNFKSKKVPVLIATDLATRGLDINMVTHVVNFDLPRSPEDYIHRIGRTARAGESGIAVSFINSENLSHFALIEKRAGIKLLKEQVEGFAFTEELKTPVKGEGAVKGKRKSKKDKLRENK